MWKQKQLQLARLCADWNSPKAQNKIRQAVPFSLSVTILEGEVQMHLDSR